MPVDKIDIDPVIEAEGDKIHRVVRAGLSLIPGVGGAAVELFTTLVTPPLEKRRQKWMVEVCDALSALQERSVLSMNKIFDSEEFISTLIEASTEAIKTHEEEKLAALRNAVLNSAIQEAPEFSRQQMFIRYISEFTNWHIRIIRFINDPAEWGNQHDIAYPNWYTAGRSSVLEHAFPALKNEREFYDQVWNDLYARGLVGSSSLHGNVSESALLSSGTTDSGKAFVKFIEFESSQNTSQTDS